MSGLLGSALLQAGIETLLYEVTEEMTLNIRAANQNETTVRYWVGIGTGANAEAKNCITPNVAIAGNEPWEDQGIVVSPGEKIWCKSNKDNVSVRIFGVN